VSNEDHAAWTRIVFAFACWMLSHVTLSGIALSVSIGVGLLQGYKTLRELRRDCRLERLEAKLRHEDTP
jgi:hypothetical protein